LAATANVDMTGTLIAYGVQISVDTHVVLTH